MKNLLSILLLTFIFTQEPILDTEAGEPCPPVCEGTCLSEEETQGLFNNIKELQFDLDKSLEINSNLQLQITDYTELVKNREDEIMLWREQVKIKEDMIKTIKPKWYENRYLWFFGGVFLTSGTVYLAGQLD